MKIRIYSTQSYSEAEELRNTILTDCEKTGFPLTAEQFELTQSEEYLMIYLDSDNEFVHNIANSVSRWFAVTSAVNSLEINFNKQ